MGGIGKTTLANEVYNHESILRRFDVRAWATVSQQHSRKEILLGLLQSTIKMDVTVNTRGGSELADMLQKSLKRKRYLIVLDDIRSCEVWDGVRQCFTTEDNAGSRILLTTRDNKVARDAGTENLSMQLNFMDQDESWSLFKSAAFSNEALSSEFETIGKKIAEKCHGLPLTIVVFAGLLKSKRAIEDWRSVAKDVTSFITNDPDKQCSHVLGWSYNHLTSDLKACLLHFGIFREDKEIPVKNLMRSLMAEGFLKLENDLEGEAEKCLQELVDRCLVLVCKKSLDGTKIRSCKVHDLIYDLCMRKIQRENIFIMNDIVVDYSDSESRYLTELPNLEVLKLMSNACDGEEWYPNARGFTRLKLLLIEDNDVKYWKATDDNFPVLERLVLKKMQISERDTCTNPHTTTDSVKMVSSQTWGICSAYLKRTRRPRKRPYGCSYLQSL
ncbi:hypothetical protein CQW23_35465 [Capsicum baccatum]|uniref:Uncharacterized protein n=1 Tax=Capsicum baccatum TaxID=33114 RepID=A0A2G2UVY0_CAPBA|nr:hypothetical protein CQW23_35465 [Capsicum baccatum]